MKLTKYPPPSQHPSVPICVQSRWPGRPFLSYSSRVSPAGGTWPTQNATFSRKPSRLPPPSSPTHKNPSQVSLGSYLILLVPF